MEKCAISMDKKQKKYALPIIEKKRKFSKIYVLSSEISDTFEWITRKFRDVYVK